MILFLHNPGMRTSHDAQRDQLPGATAILPMAPLNIERTSGKAKAAALAEMTPEVYEELRRLAANYLRGERSEHTLQRTALVHEAWLRLVGEGERTWENRAHFYRAAAQAMRVVQCRTPRHRVRGRRREGQRVLLLNRGSRSRFGSVCFRHKAPTLASTSA